MEQTPIASRRHVAIFGDTNVGKSALFNAILGQEAVIVSEHKGTTTDPVIKAMELIPYGPIALIDTAGLNDISDVGALRIEKTKGILDRTDLALYLADITSFDQDAQDAYEKCLVQFEARLIPHILVFTKNDKVSDDVRKIFADRYHDAVFTAHTDEKSIEKLKEKIVQVLNKLDKLEKKDETLIGDLLPKNSTVLLVVPIDGEAPKGRLILPQVQLIRDCLDHGIKCYVTRETELSNALYDLRKVDLVVTDSQVFSLVNEIVPREIPLTSFSMLFARQKGDLDLFIQGVERLKSLSEQAKILIAEGCTHNHSHEDIGRVKIPALIKKYTGKDMSFTFYGGHDFPKNLADFDLVIHCGACMLNKKTVSTRLLRCRDLGIPITNYGVLLAYLNGILARCIEIF
ncbi:MAG: [FeFe] hydrogenase H-cluster maturation GTPase HydF [Bacillota bacterium]|jgi:[FeFe] hydrogenase H-cluster maturation GTPase HydF